MDGCFHVKVYPNAFFATEISYFKLKRKAKSLLRQLNKKFDDLNFEPKSFPIQRHMFRSLISRYSSHEWKRYAIFDFCCFGAE